VDPRYSSGHDQELKCGISHGLLGVKSSSERAKDHEFDLGSLAIFRTKMVSGSGVRDVSIARCRA
jgi:hypothetical protein